jgi:hypothetical protein
MSYLHESDTADCGAVASKADICPHYLVNQIQMDIHGDNLRVRAEMRESVLLSRRYVAQCIETCQPCDGERCLIFKVQK